MREMEINRYGHNLAIRFTTNMWNHPKADDERNTVRGDSSQYSKSCTVKRS
jgi:hypothetical protein